MTEPTVGTVKVSSGGGWPVKYCEDRHGRRGWVEMILPPWDQHGTYDFVNADDWATVYTPARGVHLDDTPPTDVRAQMFYEADRGNYSTAALRALELAELVGANSPEGAAILTARAHVYATLNQAEVALWIKNNPR
ncbi:hypothetical protein [Mycobacteroides chelonae]|uniref:hypothetical protein n=1 Tax=Mycobacteroides chelonae TaxID=1774 RepID=UPI0012FF92DB|nr:hypothetical protein [Mycobacteroides chelonae]